MADRSIAIAGGIRTLPVDHAGHAATERRIAKWAPGVGAIPVARTFRASSGGRVANSLVNGALGHRGTDLEAAAGARLSELPDTTILGDAALDTAV